MMVQDLEPPPLNCGVIERFTALVAYLCGPTRTPLVKAQVP
jgi:hypothetical protein